MTQLPTSGLLMWTKNKLLSFSLFQQKPKFYNYNNNIVFKCFFPSNTDFSLGRLFLSSHSLKNSRDFPAKYFTVSTWFNAIVVPHQTLCDPLAPGQDHLKISHSQARRTVFVLWNCPPPPPQGVIVTARIEP